MAVIVNNPSAEPVRERNTGLGTILGIILLIILAIVLFRGLPYLGGYFGGGAAAPQVNVPGKIDVNVNNPGTGTN